MADQGTLNPVTALAKATAAVPSYTEGTPNALSQDLSGNLRVAVGTVSASMDATATAAAPSYSEGTANALSQNLTGDLRTIAKIAAAQTLATVTTVTTVAAVTAITNALPAGANLIGKVGIDQTTPGTTDSVTVATAQGAGAAIGAITGAKVVTDANGTIQQYLRGIITFLANALGAGTAAAANRVTLASDDPAVATLGATSGAAVVTDANGTIQQYLRGLIKQWIAGTLVIGTGSNTIGAVTHAAATTGGYSFLNIAVGQATTTVKSGAGTLHSIIFNSPAVATNTTTIYDNTAASGTIIAIPLATAVVSPVTLIFDIAFATGLTIITAAANGSNMTITYK